jgi:hypothetical protein
LLVAGGGVFGLNSVQEISHNICGWNGDSSNSHLPKINEYPTAVDRGPSRNECGIVDMAETIGNPSVTVSLNDDAGGSRGESTGINSSTSDSS